MTDPELKNIKDYLWHSAYMPRAGFHLTADGYGLPVLLRYADVLFKQYKAEIDADYNRYKDSRMERGHKDVAAEKCGFFHPRFPTERNVSATAGRKLFKEFQRREVEYDEYI